MRVFISHTWDDKPLAYQLQERVRRLASGIDVWIDSENIRVGDRIYDQIEKEIARSDLLVVVWTPRAKDSEGVRHEIAYARKIDLRVVPIVVVGAGGQPLCPLTNDFGRLTHHLEVSQSPTTEELDFATATIGELLFERLAADPEVAADVSGLASVIRRVGGNLRHLAGLTLGTSKSSDGGGLQNWIPVLKGDGNRMNTTAGQFFERFASSTALMEQVLEEVGRNPTNLAALRSLRQQADDLDDDAAAQQVRVVIDLRLKEPLS